MWFLWLQLCTISAEPQCTWQQWWGHDPFITRLECEDYKDAVDINISGIFDMKCRKGSI